MLQRVHAINQIFNVYYRNIEPIYMSSSTPCKRKHNDENAGTPARVISTPRDPFRTPFQPHQPTSCTPSTPVVRSHSFLDGFTPVEKKRRIVRKHTDEELAELQRAAAEQRAHQQIQAKEREADLEKSQKISQLNRALQSIRGAGFTTLHSFLDALMSTDDPARSSQVTKMIDNHGVQLLESFRRRRPEIMNDWALSTTRKLISKESDVLAQCFRPEPGTSMTDILQQFSLKGFLSEAESFAPTIYQLLQQVGCPSNSEGGMLLDGDDSAEKVCKNHELVSTLQLYHVHHSFSSQILATTLCILAKSRNDHATDFQTTMCLYLLACGTSRSLFDVLNHAGITLSYTQAVRRLKKLGEERLAQTQKIARTQAFMIIWDNLNIAFRVSEQRDDSKDHFDNGTTATLVPLYGVKYGGLPLSLKPKRTTRVPVLDFSSVDLLPTRDEAARVQAGQLWHIQDILYEAYPDLRKRLSSSILPRPTVELIPVHKTEQYPLPAMEIDESSLEGTLNVLSTIFRNSLKLSEEDIKNHGLVICAGDQLTLSLLDKVTV